MKVVTEEDYFAILFFRAYKATFLCSYCRSFTFWRMVPTSNCMLLM